MHDCFNLRFNIQKSGWDTPEDPALFAGMFSEQPENIRACLQDYANINRQALEEIAAGLDLPALAARCAGQALLLMGDSITSDRLSYGKIAALALPGRVIDGAISGSRSVNVAVDLPRCLAAHRPTLVSVMIGTNDAVFRDKACTATAVSLQEFRRNLTAIAEQVHQSRARLVLHAVPPAFYARFTQCSPYYAVTEEANAQFAACVRCVAAQTGAVYHDTRPLFRGRPPEQLFEPDGIHLSPLTQKLVARSFLQLLTTII